MTVRELIARLAMDNQDLEVMLEIEDDRGTGYSKPREVRSYKFPDDYKRWAFRSETFCIISEVY